jgi:hypothetical protein
MVGQTRSIAERAEGRRRADRDLFRFRRNDGAGLIVSSY